MFRSCDVKQWALAAAPHDTPVWAHCLPPDLSAALPFVKFFNRRLNQQLLSAIVCAVQAKKERCQAAEADREEMLQQLQVAQ